MNRYCSHCGFANAEKALRCENCKLFIGVSPQDKGISSFSGSRLIIILVVVGLLSLAIYKMFNTSPVAVKPAAAPNPVANSAVENFAQTGLDLQKAEDARKREQQAELYRQKKARRKEQMEASKDIFGNPKECSTYIDKNGETVTKGDCP